MSTMKIKKGDTVKVIAGKDKDKEGKVISVDRKNGRVLVEGVNMLTKHTKPSAANQEGGIIHQEVLGDGLFHIGVKLQVCGFAHGASFPHVEMLRAYCIARAEHTGT